MNDRCGTLGSVYTDPIVAIPENGLSTLSFSIEMIVAEGYDTGVYNPGNLSPFIEIFWSWH